MSISNINTTILRDTTLYQSIHVKDDFNLACTLTPLSPDNTVKDDYEVMSSTDIGLFIQPGLYITTTQYVSFPWLIFISLVILLLVALASFFIVTNVIPSVGMKTRKYE